MKPRNFPGRKNDRRKAALARGPSDKAGADVLRSRILPDQVARSIRTKKDRSDRGRLRT